MILCSLIILETSIRYPTVMLMKTPLWEIKFNIKGQSFFDGTFSTDIFLTVINLVIKLLILG